MPSSIANQYFAWGLSVWSANAMMGTGELELNVLRRRNAFRGATYVLQVLKMTIGDDDHHQLRDRETSLSFM